jgi:5-methylcytosine-specific restriction endonuclease McrA
VQWAAVRKAVLLRDEGRCRRCLREAAEVHHRRLKQRGGTKDEETLYGLSNLVSVCRRCHNEIHAEPALSYEQGWLVHSWQDPEDVPVPGKVKYEF